MSPFQSFRRFQVAPSALQIPVCGCAVADIHRFLGFECPWGALGEWVQTLSRLSCRNWHIRTRRSKFGQESPPTTAYILQ
jgi:hypothetical protein